MKFAKLLLAGSLAFAMAACGQTKEEPAAPEVVEATGVYTVWNGTGENVTDLYVYEVGSEDKGTNYADGGMEDAAKTKIEIVAVEDAVLVLEFTTESGYEGKFETLHIEEAPITLLSEDTMTGATQISFTAPQATGVYDLYNGTGEDVTELYVYEIAGEDKGENLAKDGMKEPVHFEITTAANAVLMVEFKTASGFEGKFETLHIEEAPITLLSEDTMTGATNISFTAPEK